MQDILTSVKMSYAVAGTTITAGVATVTETSNVIDAFVEPTVSVISMLIGIGLSLVLMRLQWNRAKNEAQEEKDRREKHDQEIEKNLLQIQLIKKQLNEQDNKD